MRLTDINSGEIKVAVATHYRYQEQCPIIAFEASDCMCMWGGGQADILVVTRDRYLIQIEVKVSISDLRKDKHKKHHYHLFNDTGEYPSRYFYFAVPQELGVDIALICDQLYPYAGVIGCPNLLFYRKARRRNVKRLSIKQVIYLVRSQTATLCRLASKVEEQKRVIANLQREKS